MASITSANAVYMLAIAGLYDTPQQLQGFSTEDIFGTDPLEAAETMIGVDGRLSGGFVFAPVNQAIHLMADSESNQVFDDWYQTEQTAREKLVASGVILLTGVGKVWTMKRGFLVTFPPMPDAKKVLQARRYGIRWESFSVAPAL